ncbi:MAG: FAD-binding oxidoreductase [Thalassovita sp.]
MTLFDDLKTILGDKGFLVAEDARAACRTDESRTGRFTPTAVMRPNTVDQVSACLAACYAAGQTVVPQGGLTGLAGGANPRAEDMVLSLSRLSGIEEIDTQSATVTVKAGSILEQVQTACAEQDLIFPVDYGARGSCQIGGMIATNAGGLRTIKYGTTRANVLGLEMVMADGRVLTHLNKATKDNTGFDLSNLMIGSEGALAVITRAVFRLFPAVGAQEMALCALASPAAAVDFFNLAREHVSVSAFEAMWPDYFEKNCTLEARQFFDEAPKMTVILEAEGDLQALLEHAFEKELILDAILPRSLSECQEIWDVREGHRMDAAMPLLMNFDVSLPLGDMAEFVARCKAGIAEASPDTQSYFFGHMGDGNLHAILYLPGLTAEQYEAELHRMDAIIYDEVRRFSGSISAEHGVGTLKRDWLGHSRSEAELDTMRAIKTALDPKGIMNPGKVV